MNLSKRESTGATVGQDVLEVGPRSAVIWLEVIDSDTSEPTLRASALGSDWEGPNPLVTGFFQEEVDWTLTNPTLAELTVGYSLYLALSPKNVGIVLRTD